MIDKRGALRLAGVGALSVLIPARAQAASRLRFAASSPFSLSYAAVFYAKSAGYFQREGLDVDIRAAKGASAAEQLVIASHADIADAGGAQYIAARIDANAPLIAIATMAQTSPFFMVLAPGSSASPSNLKGKTIGLDSLGGAMETALNLMLQETNVDAGSVKRVKAADIPASYGLILAKNIDGLMASVGPVTKIRASDPNAVAYSVNDGVAGQVFVASPTAIKGDEERYVGFLRAVHRSAAAILDAPDPKAILKAIAFVADVPDLKDTDSAVLDLKQIAQTWIAEGRKNLLRNVAEQWAAAVQAMSASHMIKTAADPTILYTNALLDKAAHADQ